MVRFVLHSAHTNFFDSLVSFVGCKIKIRMENYIYLYFIAVLKNWTRASLLKSNLRQTGWLKQQILRLSSESKGHLEVLIHVWNWTRSLVCTPGETWQKPQPKPLLWLSLPLFFYVFMTDTGGLEGNPSTDGAGLGSGFQRSITTSMI